jgi:hypothetical protein
MLTTALPAQQSIEWTQTLNLPKGLNLPKELKADILGIEIGDTYRDASAKLQSLLKESATPPRKPMDAASRTAAEIDGASTRQPLEESKMQIFLPLPGGSRIEASFVGKITLKRESVGVGPGKIRDNVDVYFSAPSSGHQVFAIVRLVSYGEHGDQPRIEPLIAALKQKFGSEARTLPGNTGLQFSYQFNDGRAVANSTPHSIACGGTVITADGVSQRDVPNINPKGECDVSMDASFNFGISKDHAQAIWFTLRDNERAKRNLTADFDFFGSYVKKLQERTGGAPPKL